MDGAVLMPPPAMTVRTFAVLSPGEGEMRLGPRDSDEVLRHCLVVFPPEGLFLHTQDDDVLKLEALALVDCENSDCVGV